MVSSKPLEKAFFIAKMSGPAMVRLASSDSWKATLFYRINEVLTFCWLFCAVLSVSGYKYMWASQYVRSRTGRLLLERLQVAEEENQDIDTTSVSADCKHPTGFPVPLSENIYCTIHHIQYILFLPKSLPLTDSLWYLIFPVILFCSTAVRILLKVGQICANCKQRFTCISPRISDQSSTVTHYIVLMTTETTEQHGNFNLLHFQYDWM